MNELYFNEMKKRISAGLFAPMIVIAAVLLAGCSKSSSSNQPAPGRPPVPVLVAQAVKKNVPVQVSAIGNVTALSKVTIRSQVTGQLKEVHFREGEEVKKGDLLFTIDPRPLQAALDSARANLARDGAQLGNARIQFDRERKLFDQKLVSQDEFDTSKASLDTLTGTVAADQAAITNGMLNLAYASITSPMDGVAGSQLVFVGNIIKSPDDAMLMLNQVHPIYVLFSVPEQYLPEIRAETRKAPLKVEVTFQNMTGPPRVGELTFIDNAVDVTTGMIQLKARFANEDNALWPGQFVQVALTLSELSDAIVVPSQAIQVGQNGEYVFVVKPDQTVEMRPVKRGDTLQEETVVLSGLQADETVVTDGHLRLKPDAKVMVKPAQADSASSTNAPNSRP